MGELSFFLSQLQLKDFLDLLLLYILIYQALKFFEKTGIYQIIVGMGVVALAFVVSERLELISVHTVLAGFFSNILLIIVFLFQHEIKRGLSQIGSQSLFNSIQSVEQAQMIEELSKALKALSQSGKGALIVFENKVDLASFIEVSTDLKCGIKNEILQAIFHPSSLIHDGALIIRNDQIEKVGAFLPLSVNPALDKKLGTRHRAAFGISEITDAKVVVLSEESRKIALVEEGRMKYVEDSARLPELLREFISNSKSLREI